MRQDLREVLESVLEVDSISDDDTAQTVPSWDSVRHLNLVLALEEHFGLTFEADEIAELISVRAISEAISKRTANAG
jgi:acyl carrier protein